MANTTITCTRCDGTGECQSHDEYFVDADISKLCESCGSINAVCPECQGTGEIDNPYDGLEPLDPRD